MPARKPNPSGPRGKGRRTGGRGAPAIPLWLLLALFAGLALAMLLRCKVSPPPPAPKAPESHQEQPPARPPKSASKTPRAQVAEPPPAPESPSQERTAPRPLPVGPERRVCLVIDDAGYSLDLAQTAAEALPKETTFAIIPFLSQSEATARLLHERGFAVILHCPMEPERSGQWKPTPGTLMVGMPPAEVTRILDRDLEAVPFAEGANNHMGSLATTNRPLMDGVMEDLKRRGLYFLDSRTSARTVAYDAARAAGARAAFRSVFLDDVDEDGAIIRQIDAWAGRSEREGAPVAIGHLRPKTINALAFRLPYWRAKGVRVVTLREVVH